MATTSKPRIIYKKDLLYPELSYQVLGVLFNVFKQLGFGHRERYCQNAIESALKNSEVSFQREDRTALLYQKDKIGTLIPDFTIEDKIILEIKQGNFFNRKDIYQTYEYLKTRKMQLGILARFTKYGVRYKRIANVS